MNVIERAIEGLFFSSRWLMAPFLFGLIAALIGLLYRFRHRAVYIRAASQERRVQ